jgi:hypothetical protein
MSGSYGIRGPAVHFLQGFAGVVIALATTLLIASGCGSTAGSGVTVENAGSDDRETLCRRIDAALAQARDGRLLDARVNGAWQVVHGILAFGDGLPLATASGTRPALSHLLGGGGLTGWRVREGARGVVASIDEGSTTGQGHPDQWMGYLSQCGIQGLPVDTPLVVGGKPHTLRDLLTQSQADIRPGREATWTLMALSRWLPHDAEWTAADGRRWTVEEVVGMEAEAEVDGAACGGAHRLYALATALAARREALAAAGRDATATGGWAEARACVDRQIERARTGQQPDGSFSVHFFARPGTSTDVFARLGATGHIFELLVVALDDERLAEPWVTRAATRLVTLLEQTSDVDVECGALYHAAHGLLLYRERICGDGRTR